MHCSQINSLELGNSTHKRFDGNHFLLSRGLRMENMKSGNVNQDFRAKNLMSIPSIALRIPTVYNFSCD